MVTGKKRALAVLAALTVCLFAFTALAEGDGFFGERIFALTQSDGSEETLMSIAEGYGTVVLWHYDDYDGDGTCEMFFGTGSFDEDWGTQIDKVYFVDGSGNVRDMGDVNYTLYNENDNCFRVCQGKGFFWSDVGAGGSGWLSFVYGVKNGEPYALDISMKVQGFYEENGVFSTTMDDFSEDFHQYLDYELIYDPATQQFLLGGPLNQ